MQRSMRGPRPNQVIDLSKDDDEVTRMKLMLISDEEDESTQPPKFYIEITDDDDDDDAEEIVHLLTVTKESSALKASTPSRILLDSVELYGGIVKRGVTLELIDGDFLLVKNVFIAQDDELYLEGTILYRTYRVRDMLPKKNNELCMMVQSRIGDGNSGTVLDVRPLSCVDGYRDVIYTNRPFPESSWRQNTRQYKSVQEFRELSELVCRWKFTEYFESDSQKVKLSRLERLSKAECDDGEWVAKEYFSASSTRGRPQTSRSIQYSYGDICAGGGGTLRGALMAGLKPELVLDNSSAACSTLQRNAVGGMKVMECDIHDFCLKQAYGGGKIDILHISFPCQPHSAIHVRPGSMDHDNIATGYSVKPIVQKCKPRNITFEQTTGIITHRGGWHFRALIHQLTDVEYSVTWKIVDCAEYGNAHARKRLIIIAAAPGETLPRFPRPTHGKEPGLKRFVTIADILTRVPRLCEGHMAVFTQKNSVPYDGRQPLRQCITTNGGTGDLHPSGTRSFTLQELAMLQGFPRYHLFARESRTEIRRQIGNAVPSCLAKILFETIIQSLRRTDYPEVIEID